jgi:hypothetical protein
MAQDQKPTFGGGRNPEAEFLTRLASQRAEMKAGAITEWKRSNRAAGFAADALGALDDFARAPFGFKNPPAQIVSDIVGVPSLRKTLERMSYGQPLTNARQANVPFLKPETADALMMAPLSPRTALAALMGGFGDAGAAKAIFAGITAKTADRAALAQAEKLTAAGADPRAIWRDTGWMKGGDGKWRFEIDDSAAKARDYQLTPKEAYQQARQEAAWSGGDPARAAGMNDYAGMPVSALRAEFKRTGGEISAAAIAGDKPKAMQLLDDRRGLDALLTEMGNRPAGPMSAYLKHGELGQAYPDVYKLHTRIDPTLDAQGQYLRGSAHQGEQMVLKEKPTWTDARSTALHEMQHAVQQREGFARGGSPDALAQEYGQARARLHFLEQEPEFKAANQELDSLWDAAFTKGTISESEAIAKEAELLRRHPSLAEQRQLLDALRGSSEDGYSAYKNLAGEAEARAVQARMKLNQQQRRELFPLDSYDVPISGLIYR